MKKYGELWLDIAEFKKWGDFCPCIKITDLDSAIGFEGACLIESGSIYCPIDDKEKLKSALDCCGYLMTDKGLYNGQKTYNKRHNMYWVLIAMAFDAYYGIEQDSSYAQITVQTDESAPMEFQNWQAQERINCDIETYVKDNYL